MTVALRRVDFDHPDANILQHVPKGKILLPNTSGARTADEAVRLAAEILEHRQHAGQPLGQATHAEGQGVGPLGVQLEQEGAEQTVGIQILVHVVRLCPKPRGPRRGRAAIMALCRP